MQNRTVAIVVTILTAAVCGCFGILSCVFGGMIAAGTPFDVTVNGQVTKQTFPSTIGYVLLCLSLLLILVPVAVGFFTLRKKQEVAVVPNPNEPMPPAA